MESFLICDQKGNVVNFACVPNQQHPLIQFMHAYPQQHFMFFSDKAEEIEKVNFLPLFLDLSLSRASH